MESGYRRAKTCFDLSPTQRNRWHSFVGVVRYCVEGKSFNKVKQAVCMTIRGINFTLHRALIATIFVVDVTRETIMTHFGMIERTRHRTIRIMASTDNSGKTLVCREYQQYQNKYQIFHQKHSTMTPPSGLVISIQSTVIIDLSQVANPI